MKARGIIDIIESFSPSGIQESWDNSGLIIGDPEANVSGVLICLDITEEIMDEAVHTGCEMIISHHPLVFKGMKKFSGNDLTSRLVRKAFRENLIIYSAHTNLDQVPGGVSGAMADRIGLVRRKILVPRRDDLLKLVTFIPDSHFEEVTEAVFKEGAGHIGNYDSCGFSVSGTGSFRAGEDASPFSGKIGEHHYESEKRFETIFPRHLESNVIKSLKGAHPYDEVAYDIYPLANENPALGLGIIGELPEEMTEPEFMDLVREVFQTSCIRHTAFLNKKVKRVALMGGSGIEFMANALAEGADAYVTADIKYHQFFEADGKLLLVDIGHYESEQVALELLNNLLSKKMTNFAVHLSKISTNPINYF